MSICKPHEFWCGRDWKLKVQRTITAKINQKNKNWREMDNREFLFCITGNLNMSGVLHILMIQNTTSAEGGRRVSKTLADKAISQSKPQVSPMFEKENFAHETSSIYRFIPQWAQDKGIAWGWLLHKMKKHLQLANKLSSSQISYRISLTQIRLRNTWCFGQPTFLIYTTIINTIIEFLLSLAWG